MPSFGLKQKLGVAVLTAAIFALSAGAASANEAWLWACHGPGGGPIATPMTSDPLKGDVKGAGAVTYNCGGDDNTGATLSLNGANPAGQSNAALRIALPGGATVKRIVITHAVHGTSAGAHYGVGLGSQGSVLDVPLDDPVTTLPADFTASGNGSDLILSLSCPGAAACGGPVSADIVKVGILVDDTTAPYGGVGRNSPVNRTATLVANATDTGVGLGSAVATIASAPSDNAAIATSSKTIGTCNDLTNGGALDLPLDPRCEAMTPSTALDLDTAGLAEGTYYRRVVVYDAVGNGQDLISSVWEPFEVWHPVLGSPSQTLSIGSSSIVTENPQQNPGQNNNGVQGNQSSSCRSPRLSVSLGQKPLRVSKSVAVLKYGKRYRFEGRLTCVVNGRRISAPKRTKVELLNKIGKKTYTKTGPKIASKGRFKLSLKYPAGTRTLIFRFRNADGQRSQVSIKIKTEKKKKSKKR